MRANRSRSKVVPDRRVDDCCHLGRTRSRYVGCVPTLVNDYQAWRDTFWPGFFENLPFQATGLPKR